jgi:hypothetical protein
VRRRFLKFGTPIARNLRHMRPTPCDYWHTCLTSAPMEQINGIA